MENQAVETDPSGYRERIARADSGLQRRAVDKSLNTQLSSSGYREQTFGVSGTNLTGHQEQFLGLSGTGAVSKILICKFF
jgi:hypothetical protein